MNAWKRLKTIPATVWMLGAISFLNDAASEWVYPLLPLYLSSVLMAGPRVMGLIEGIAEATSSLLKLISGVWVDKTGRAKPWVISGYTSAALSRPLLAFVSTWPVLLLLRFIDRVGKGLRGAPRDVMIASSAEPDQKGLAFGIHRACDHAGAVAGPVMASLLLGLGLALDRVILWAAIPGIAVVILTLLLKEPQRQDWVAAKSYTLDWRLGLLPRAFKRYLFALACFTLGNASNLFLLLHASKIGIADAQIPLLWAVVAAVATLLTAPLSAWSDLVGRRQFIVIGWAAYAVFYLALGCLSPATAWMIWPLFILYGVFIAATEGIEKALVSDLVPASSLGRAFGWFHLTAGLLLLPASLLFGVVWHYLGAQWAFTLAALLSLAGSGLMWFLCLEDAHSEDV